MVAALCEPRDDGGYLGYLPKEPLVCDIVRLFRASPNLVLPGQLKHLDPQRWGKPKSSLCLQPVKLGSEAGNQIPPSRLDQNAKHTDALETEFRGRGTPRSFIHENARSLDFSSQRQGFAFTPIQAGIRHKRMNCAGRAEDDERREYE